MSSDPREALSAQVVATLLRHADVRMTERAYTNIDANVPFRDLLRVARPGFRRVLLMLAWTGARPGELRGLRWADVDLEKGVAVIRRKPRRLVLIARAAKLLVWLKKRSASEVVFPELASPTDPQAN